MDITGRKKAIIGGLVISGICLILMTRFTSVYPTLLIIFCILCCGMIPANNAPLVNDYVDPSSIGIALSISSVIAFTG